MDVDEYKRIITLTVSRTRYDNHFLFVLWDFDKYSGFVKKELDEAHKNISGLNIKVKFEGRNPHEWNGLKVFMACIRPELSKIKFSDITLKDIWDALWIYSSYREIIPIKNLYNALTELGKYQDVNYDYILLLKVSKYPSLIELLMESCIGELDFVKLVCSRLELSIEEEEYINEIIRNKKSHIFAGRYGKIPEMLEEKE